MKALFKKIAQKIYLHGKAQSIVNVADRSKLHPNIRLKSAILMGDISLGEGCMVIGGVRLSGAIEVGRYTSINGPNTQILAGINPIQIGSFCSIARGVSFQEYYHRFDRPSSYFFNKNIFGEQLSNDVYSKGPIFIGNDVWIGVGAVILSGVNIGNGAIIGANSVVTRDVEPYSIVGGSPAKLIRYRFSKQIVEQLEELAWWDWPRQKIIANRSFFSKDISSSTFEQFKMENI